MTTRSSGQPTVSRPGGLERYRLALEAGRMGTWHWDIATGVVDWDEPLERVFGVEPGGFTGTMEHYAALLHPDDREPTLRAIEQALAARSDHYVEHRVVLPDGGIRWVSGTGRVVVDADGEPTAMVGVGADITERKLAEAQTLAAETAERVALDAAHSSRRRLAVLGRASGILGASLDVDTTLQQVADLTVAELADWCAVDLVIGGEGVHHVAVAHRDPAMVAFARDLQQRYPVDLETDAGVGGVIRSGEPQLWREVPMELLEAGARDAEHLEIIRALSMRTAVVVPLTARGQILGAMTLVGTGDRLFDEDDLVLATELGRRAGLAVDNARLFAERDQVASTLQRSLLPPSLPAIAGVDLAACYHPGRAALDIGGDFYDVFSVGPGCWRVVVGDVCGKGADAAALTGAIRYTVRAGAMQDRDPASVLRLLNDALLAEDWHGRFCTIAFIALDVGPDGRVHTTAAVGGHPFPLVRRRDGSLECGESNGMLLGLLPGAEPSLWSFDLEPGDCLVAYTDGVTEARSGRELFGDQRLRAVVAAAPAQSARDVVAAIEDAVDSFLAAGPQQLARDDMAVLTVRVTGEPADA